MASELWGPKDGEAADADAAIDEVVSRLGAGLDVLLLPDIVPAGSPVAESAERMRALVRERLNAFG